MAVSLLEYKNLFRESYVQEQDTLFGIHILFFAAVNSLWVIMNMVLMPSKYRWLMYYPIVGWGLLLFAHYWFYVRNAEGFCRRKEERIGSRVEVT